jgi:large subunit ribosomal protein L15
MKYNDLNIEPKKVSKRLGRGISAGQGKTAGRGTKGQKARTGSKMKPGFQGGTNPVMQQLPKLPGFRSYKVKAVTVTVGQLEGLKTKTIDGYTLAEAKLVDDPYSRIKLLAGGELKTAKTVKLPEASQTAIAAINKAGGSFEKVARLKQLKKSSDSKA